MNDELKPCPTCGAPCIKTERTGAFEVVDEYRHQPNGGAGAEDARGAADWRELCRRLYVELFHCDQQMTSGKRQKWKTGSKVKQVLDDASAALAAMSDQNKGKV